MFIFLLIFLVFYALYYYFSYQVILLRDLHEIFNQTATKAQTDLDLNTYSDYVLEDLSKCYLSVLLIILLTTLLSFIWILLLKYNAKLIIWLSIFSLPIFFSGCLYYSVRTYLQLRDANAGAGANSDANNQPADEQSLAFGQALQTILTVEFMSYVHNESLWLAISIILFLVLIILFIVLHTLRERVGLSIALIRYASKAINGVKSTLLFPIIPRTFGVAALVYGILISLLIISASQPQYQIDRGPRMGQSCHPKLFRTNATRLQGSSIWNGDTFVKIYTEVPVPENERPRCVPSPVLNRQHVWKYHAVNLFATLWLIHFISGISQTTLAGAFASYYWAFRKPQDVPFFAVTASLGRVIRYHLGDIAFGSFLIATIRYIRIVIEFIDNRIRRKGSPEANNRVAHSAACFFRIFFWILDRFLKYIDRNAYIMMSMYGEGYLQSAKRAVELLYKNTTRAIVLDYVTYFVLFVSRLLITGLGGYITAQEVIVSELRYRWLPVAIVVVVTYFISKGLFSVYSMAVDTLFMCFLIDSTNNDGSAERPYFMSKDLRRLLKRNTMIS